mmetsp:Transcript_11171/g.10189  ORF Transcript_11171/g.10189 Transcript_11171/m.10189 type:complete len:150 (-) Transcript_11171:109-558(-)
MATVKGGETEEGYDAEKAARKEAKRRLKASKAAKHDLETKDVPGSSLSVGKLYAVKHDDEWEGNEDFSDDDELLDEPLFIILIGQALLLHNLFGYLSFRLLFNFRRLRCNATISSSTRSSSNIRWSLGSSHTELNTRERAELMPLPNRG